MTKDMDKLSVAREALEQIATVARSPVTMQAIAREALAALAQPAPDGVRFTATVGIRRQTKSIDSLAELLRLINGGATLADIRIATPTAALTPAPQPAEGAWQPIETAPMGVNLLVGWYYRDAWRCHVALAVEGGRFFGFGGTSYDIEYFPTHWQPLPAPPAAAIRGGSE